MSVDVETGTSSFEPITLGSRRIPAILINSHDEAQLRRQVNSIDGDKVARVAILSFRTLQLYRIAKLQAALIREQHALSNNIRTFSNGESNRNELAENGERVDALIQRYADAVRNYETLAQVVQFKKDTEYEFLGGNQKFEIVERGNVSRWLAVGRGEGTVQLYGIGPLNFRELDRKRFEKRKLLMAFKLRFHMALAGSTALLVPVILMALYSNLHTRLAITSAATVIFAALVVFLGTDSSGKDVLTSTAAYTAVLVVFVGAGL